MSGGSYEYLCFKDWHDIANAQHQIIAMCDRLIELGYEDVAAETEALRLRLRQQEVLINATLKRLSGVWEAVEWKDSGDSGLEYIEEAVKKYRGEN